MLKRASARVNEDDWRANGKQENCQRGVVQASLRGLPRRFKRPKFAPPFFAAFRPLFWRGRSLVRTYTLLTTLSDLVTAAARFGAADQHSGGRNVKGRIRSYSSNPPATNRVPDKRC